jgi:hypothetical protein
VANKHGKIKRSGGKWHHTIRDETAVFILFSLQHLDAKLKKTARVGVAVHNATVPTNEDEISNEKVKELFKIIKSYPDLTLNDPLVLDPNAPNTAKISRSLQRDSKFIDFLNNELDIELDPLNGAKWNGITICSTMRFPCSY